MDSSNARFPAVVYALAAVPAIVMACVAVSLPRTLATEPIALIRTVSSSSQTGRSNSTGTSSTTAFNSTSSTSIFPSNSSSSPNNSLNITLIWQEANFIANKTAFNWPIDVDPLLADGMFALANVGFSFGLFEVCAYYGQINTTRPRGSRGDAAWLIQNQTCVDMRTYCSQGRISSGACAAVHVSQLASVAHVALHASALVVMWVGVSLLSPNSPSRSVRTKRDTHWPLSQRDKCADQTHLRRVGARVLFASFVMQGVAELLSAASLVIACLAFARDPFLSKTDESLKLLEDDSRSYHSLSLGVSAQLLMASLALNTLMSIITFFRYKSAIFPSSNNNKNGKSDTPSSLEVQHNSIRRNSSDTGYSNADETHNPSLFNDRFDAWAKSATAANPYTLPIHMHTLSKNDAISTMQPSIIHETKSNHSGGSAHHHRIHPTPASPSTSLPIGLPSLFHDTKSNHSNNGSMYNGSTSFTPIPAQSISPRTSATMDESSMLVQRRSRRKSGSTPPMVPGGLLPKFPLPNQHGAAGALSPVSGAIMAVVPPRDGEWDEIDFQLFGASEYRGITVEYIEMKPAAAVVSAENGSSKAAPTMMGTVVFDDD
ncbi:hypothetical protein HDU80_001218 [Chytriomyces hyalinus]|nr:hypothetical protein HDU80_001218 [Chytriomyces hyalinus]